MSFVSAKASTDALIQQLATVFGFLSCACLAWQLRTSSVETGDGRNRISSHERLYSYSVQAMSKLEYTHTFGVT